MSKNRISDQQPDHLKEYQRKMKAGELPKPERLTPRERAKRNPTSLKAAILAKCYECCGEYADGRWDCGITDCSLYRWMPYKHRRPVSQ